MTVLGPSGPKLPKLMSTREISSKYANILIYSLPRFGKTNGVRDLVKHGFRPFIIGCENGDGMGLQTISDLDVPVCRVTKWEEFQLVCAELNRKPDICQYSGSEIDVVVLDSLSALGRIWEEKGLEVLGWEEIGVPGPGHDTRNMYAYIPEKGRQTAKLILNVRAHVILICREKLIDVKGNRGEILGTYPSPELPGQQLPRELPGWIDGVVLGKFLNGERVLMTEAEGKTIAGIRMPEGQRFPKYIRPDYGLLIKAMKGDQEAMKALKLPEKKAPSTSTSTTTQVKK